MQKLYRNDPESAREIEKNGFSWREQFIDIHGERIVYESVKISTISTGLTW